MRRLIAAFAALVALAAPAWATNTDLLVVRYRPTTITVGIQRDCDEQWRAIRAILDRYVGPTHYMVVDPEATTTLWCNTGTQVLGWARGQTVPTTAATRQFAAVMHVGFDAASGVFPYTASPVRLDSLLRSGTASPWAGGSSYGTSVPQIVIGKSRADANQWANASTCSTGVTGYAGPNAQARAGYTHYMVGKTYAWKVPDNGVLVYAPPALGSAGSRAPGIFRAIVSYGATGIINNATCNCAHLNAAGNCDNVTRSADPDSVILWARYLSSADVAPRIFLQPGQTYIEPELVKMALAVADSVTGGGVFPDKDLLFRKRAILIRHGFSRGKWSNNSAENGGGTFCAADTCDSANVIAGIDSLANLDVPFTVGCEAESMHTSGSAVGRIGVLSEGYPSERAWWARAPKAHYCIESYAGTAAGVDNGIAAAGAYLYDPLGNARARFMLPPNETSLPPSHWWGYSADSSVFSLMSYAVNRMRETFPGKFSPVIVPAFWDYSPLGTDGSTVGQYEDSLTWVLMKAGIRAIIVCPSALGSNDGRQYVIPASQNPTYWTAPFGWSNEGRSVAVGTTPGATTKMGRFKFIPARGEAPSVDTLTIQNAAGTVGPHPIAFEFSYGVNTGIWWPSVNANSIFYRHEFLMRTPILAFKANQLGGKGVTGYANRQAFWNIKWAVSMTRATDALMIPGKTLDVWTYPEFCEP